MSATSPVLGHLVTTDPLDECRLELDVVRASVDHLTSVIDTLDAGLEASRRTGIALGIVMGRHGVTECEATALLGERATRRGLTPLTLADEVIRTGSLPGV